MQNKCFIHRQSHDWTIALYVLDVNSAYEYFVQFVNNLLDQFVPLSKPTPHSRYRRFLKILYGKCKTLVRVAPNSDSCLIMPKRFQKSLHKFHCSLENRIVSSANSSVLLRINSPALLRLNGELFSSNCVCAKWAEIVAPIYDIHHPDVTHSIDLNTSLRNSYNSVRKFN